MKNYFKLFKETFFKSAKEVDNFATERGSQKYKLPDYPWLYDEVPDSVQSLYTELYNNVPILDGAIDAYINLINPGWTLVTSKITDQDKNNDLLKNIGFNAELNRLIANYFIYGYSGSEVVLSPDMKQIIRLVNIPSQDLRIKRNEAAQITNFYQINTFKGGSRFIDLNINRFIYLVKDGTTKEPYGRSLFKSLPFLTRIMLEMQDSIGKIYKKYGSPRFHVKYIPAVQLSDKVLKSRLDVIKDKFDNPKVGEDFFTAGDVEVAVIGAGGEEIKFTVEMSEIMQGIFSGLKLPAGLLGYNYGSTETHLAKQLEILLGKIVSCQTEISDSINKQFMPLVAKVYNLKEVPQLTFNRSIIADEKAEAETEEIKLRNLNSLISLGLIDDDYIKNKLHLPEMTGKREAQKRVDDKLKSQMEVKSNAKES